MVLELDLNRKMKTKVEEGVERASDRKGELGEGEGVGLVEEV
jgi:hypothetical protein